MRLRAVGVPVVDSDRIPPERTPMLLRQIFDPDLAQYSYIIGDRRSAQALVIDPHRDVDQYLALAREEQTEIVAVMETHIHADFLSGTREMVESLGVRAYLSAEGTGDWRYRWSAESGGGEVVLLRGGDRVDLGSVRLTAMATPGHTPEHLCFLVHDLAADRSVPMGFFSGDFLLVGDLGRPDLLELAGGMPGSREQSARELHRSLDVLEDLPDHLLVWPGHGAGSSCGKSIGAVPVSTLGYERRTNAALRAAGEGEAVFIRAILADQPTPPTYFTRMKSGNRDGPPLLGDLPRPRQLAAAEVESVIVRGEMVLLDARPDRQSFMARHLPGALQVPSGRGFSTAVGSVVTDEMRPIVLVVEDEARERLTRDLVRMGYDRIVATVDPEELETFFDAGGAHESIPSTDFEGVRRRLASSSAVVVDVRDHFEYDRGHIPGAVNAPYTRLPEYEERIPPDRPLLVHCESGARSAVAAAWLTAQGREVTYVDDTWPGEW